MLPIVKLDFESVRTRMSLGNKNYWYDMHKLQALSDNCMLALLTKKQSYSSFSETAHFFTSRFYIA